MSFLTWVSDDRGYVVVHKLPLEGVGEGRGRAQHRDGDVEVDRPRNSRRHGSLGHQGCIIGHQGCMAIAALSFGGFEAPLPFRPFSLPVLLGAI